jgi:hypothetical protein
MENEKDNYQTFLTDGKRLLMIDNVNTSMRYISSFSLTIFEE